MTNEHFHDLARRLVACPGFRWLPGMLTYDQAPEKWKINGRIQSRVCERVPDDIPPGYTETMRAVGWLPDLSDPLTCLAVLLLVREAWRGDRIELTLNHNGDATLRVLHPGEHLRRAFPCDSEAAALVAALEAAPPR